uniref:Nucleoside diphosphate kinase 3 isoform X1 n=1 Tax=Rhizophora mucronata TaxID=61149 RepID=A0A2P2LFB1_RHIMU
MSSQLFRYASRAARSLLSCSKSSRFHSEGRAVAAAAAVSFGGKVPLLASAYRRTDSADGSRQWIPGALAIPAAGYLSLHLESKVFFFLWFFRGEDDISG